MHKSGRGRWGYFFLALGACSARAMAAEYYLEPSIAARYEFDSNRNLNPTNAQSASTWRFSPFVGFGRLTPNSEVAGAARVEVNESNRKEIDSTDVYAGLFPVYRTERDQWSLDATYRRDTNFRTNIREKAFFQGQRLGQEVLPADPKQEDTNIGQTRGQQEVRRNVVFISPAWRRQLSARYGLGVEYTYVDTFYGSAGTSRLVDSQRHLGRADLSYNLSGVDDVSVFTAFQNFQNDQNREFDTYRVGFGLSHRFSETLRAILNVGPEYTDESVGKDDFGYAVTFRVSKELEKSRLEGAFRRGVSPNEEGVALERNQIDIRWFGDLSARWSFSLLARAFQNERATASAGGAVSNSRYYAQVEPAMSYRFTEALSCELSYRFRWEDEEVAGPGGGSAFAHAGLFTVNYAFDRLSLSR